MKTKSIIVAIVLIISFIGCNAQNTLNETNLYFGQKPPGRKAEFFAPQVLTIEPHESPIICKNETLLVIGTMEEGVKFYTMINGNLTLVSNPFNFNITEIANGVDVFWNGLEISNSEEKMYIKLYENGGEKFYYIERQGENWSKPKLLNPEVNAFKSHWQYSLAKNENLYLPSDGIKVAKYNGNTHLKPIPLILEDNSEMKGGTPYIAPDESYIIFSRDNDLHISYHLNNGKWSKPKNLGSEINAEGLELCPRISPNGKYLFFISRRPGPDWAIYWADASFIEELKPKDLK